MIIIHPLLITYYIRKSLVIYFLALNEIVIKDAGLKYKYDNMQFSLMIFLKFLLLFTIVGMLKNKY